MYSKILSSLFFLFLFSSCGYIPVNEVNVYVSVDGDDSNDGTVNFPLKTMGAAFHRINQHLNKKKINIILKDGIYYLDSSINITHEYSVRKKYPISIKAENSGEVTISGGRLLSLKWEKMNRSNIYVAYVPTSIKTIDQLYVNGKVQLMARYPNAIHGKNVFDTWNLKENSVSYMDPVSKECVKRWSNPQGAYLHAMHESLWGDMHWLVTGKDREGMLTMEGGWQNNRPSKMHPVYRMIENIYEELDVPSEWFFDSEKHKLYYIPDENVDLDDAKIEIVVLENLIHIAGSMNNTVSNIHIEGLKFTQTARTFMKNKEPLLRSDWTVYRGGTILFEGAEDCSIKNCEFDQVGGNTIVLSNYNKGIEIKSCYIHDSGASGIVFVGNPKMVREPLFGYVRNDNYETMDRTPGPKGYDFPQECTVEDCLITRTGRHEKQTAPVQISMSYRITVNHCSIYDVPRAGINISEGTFGGHVIEYCDVFNTVLETGDHGSFNSWGRDRYWTPNVNTVSAEVEKDTLLPYLDMIDINVIRNSRWRCDHGWDIDLDDGSSFYHIYNNVLLNRGLKLREGYKRVVKNNIIINSSLHPHVWYKNSGDIVTGNIFSCAYQPALMNKDIPSDGKWGHEVDYNFFIDETSMRKFNKNGCDIHSKVVKFDFINPQEGDYTLPENSEIIKSGFKNIEMDFGVYSEKLKVIAKQPVFPDINISENNLVTTKTIVWQGLKLKKIETLGEQSALGYKELCGLIVLSVDNDSPWKNKVNLNDLIIECNGKSVCSVEDIINMKGTVIQSIRVWRTQNEILLK